MMMLLEASSSSTNFFSKKVSRWLNENMKILTYMTGRGLFYCFIGTVREGGKKGREGGREGRRSGRVFQLCLHA